MRAAARMRSRSNGRSCPSAPRGVIAPATSAGVARRSARERARAEASAVMNCVPLMSARPSFASSTIGASPPARSASRPGAYAPRPSPRPSPISASARCASGARSPHAPTEPCDGTCGRRPCRASRRAARSSRHARRSSPAPACSHEGPSWRARRRRGRDRRRRTRGCGPASAGARPPAPGGRLRDDRPNPVLTPYVWSPTCVRGTRAPRSPARGREQPRNVSAPDRDVPDVPDRQVVTRELDHGRHGASLVPPRAASRLPGVTRRRIGRDDGRTPGTGEP